MKFIEAAAKAGADVVIYHLRKDTVVVESYEAICDGIGGDFVKGIADLDDGNTWAKRSTKALIYWKQAKQLWQEKNSPEPRD